MHRKWVGISSVFASGLAVNALSDQLAATAPVIVVLVVVALTLLVAADSTSSLPSALLPGPTANLIKFCLFSFLIGVVVGAVAVIPIWQSQEIHVPNSTGYFHNYELAAATCITVISGVAAFRRSPVFQWVAYLIAAIAGMTLAVMYLSPDANDASGTFLGWLAASTFVTAVMSILRDVGRLFTDFLGRHPAPAPAPTPTPGPPAPTPAPGPGPGGGPGSTP